MMNFKFIFVRSSQTEMRGGNAKDGPDIRPSERRVVHFLEISQTLENGWPLEGPLKA